VVAGDDAYRLQFYETDALSASQKQFCEDQYRLFKAWYADWTAQGGVIAECM